MAKKPTKRAGDWFHKKSPAAQKAYIKAHPNSIYARRANVAKKAATGSTAEVTRARRALENHEAKEPNANDKVAYAKWEKRDKELQAKLTAARKAVR